MNAAGLLAWVFTPCPALLFTPFPRDGPLLRDAGANVRVSERVLRLRPDVPGRRRPWLRRRRNNCVQVLWLWTVCALPDPPGVAAVSTATTTCATAAHGATASATTPAFATTSAASAAITSVATATTNATRSATSADCTTHRRALLALDPRPLLPSHCLLAAAGWPDADPETDDRDSPPQATEPPLGGPSYHFRSVAHPATPSTSWGAFTRSGQPLPTNAWWMDVVLGGGAVTSLPYAVWPDGSGVCAPCPLVLAL
jgi:hypothetical protein